jgi:hypothetical protein
MIHCANCDAIFEAHDSPAGTTCPRCGAVAAVHRPDRASQPAPAAPLTPNHGGADFWFEEGSSKDRFSLSGRPGILRWTKNVAVRFTTAVCPHCGRKVARGSAACPFCGQALKRDAAGSSDFAAAIKKMLLAATLFIGLPAGVIVFVLVVCAPQGANVAKAPKARRGAGAAQGAAAQPASPEAAPPQRRTPLSVFRSMRDKLRGTEHDGGSVPAKPALEKTSDGPTNTNVPAVGTGNGNQVKPDAPH